MTPEKQEKIEQLERVLQSRTLQNSESLKAFLRYVVEKTMEDDGVQLKEYTIATEVFGRNTAYDPRIDSVVRVQAGRLRTKLQEYYTTEGKADQIVIDLPKGHYHPVFNYADLQATAVLPEFSSSIESVVTTPVDHHPEIRKSSISKSTVSLIVLGVLVVLLIAAVLTLYSRARQLQHVVTSLDPSVNNEDFKAVWSAFVNDPDPPLLILSSPTLVRFLNDADPKSLAQRAIPLTPEQKHQLIEAPEFKGQWSGGDSPRLVPSLGMYTGMGEAVGLYRLAELFKASNKSVVLKQSRHVSAADLKFRNVILLGSIYVNEWSRKLPTIENFVYTFSATIENRNPLPGEEREYKPEFDPQTGQLLVDYALITVKPNISGEHAVMTLAGIFSEGTEGAAEFATTRNHVAVLGPRLRQLGKNGPPNYYQALLKVEVENGTPTTITLLSLRELSESTQ